MVRSAPGRSHAQKLPSALIAAPTTATVAAPPVGVDAGRRPQAARRWMEADLITNFFPVVARHVLGPAAGRMYIAPRMLHSVLSCRDKLRGR